MTVDIPSRPERSHTVTTFSLRFYLTNGETVQTNHADDDVLKEVLRLLADTNAFIKIPDDDDVYEERYGDQPTEDRYHKFTIIPVRAITHVQKF